MYIRTKLLYLIKDIVLNWNQGGHSSAEALQFKHQIYMYLFCRVFGFHNIFKLILYFEYWCLGVKNKYIGGCSGF